MGYLLIKHSIRCNMNKGNMDNMKNMDKSKYLK